MPIRISKTATAEVAHYLEDHPLEHNRRLHGHSILVTVTAEGDKHLGVVQDFGVFGAQVKEIVGLLDHTCLNDHFPEIDPPTLENIAEWLGRAMSATGGERRIVSVKVERPTCGETAEWTP